MKRFLCLLLCLLLTPVLACAGAHAEPAFAEFSTVDMEGHDVTQEIFAGYDLTVVNVWATWCGYCIAEMPELAKLKTMLPENVNFITMCTDAADNRELAGAILRDSGANFQTLVVDDAMYARIAALTSGFPTTFFLNSAGELTVQPLVGVPSLDDPAQAYCDITMSVLGLLEG